MNHRPVPIHIYGNQTYPAYPGLHSLSTQTHTTYPEPQLHPLHLSYNSVSWSFLADDYLCRDAFALAMT